MDYAHREARIVHRDLKPANLLLDEKGRLKIADFGIAHSLSDSVTRVTGRKGESGGTPAYMSPQQANGKRPTASDDIYSLGATLYDLLTGKPPYLGGHASVVLGQLLDANNSPPTIASRRYELQRVESFIPGRWEEIVAKCLSKDHRSRPPSVGDVATHVLENATGVHDSQGGTSSPRQLTLSTSLLQGAAGTAAVAPDKGQVPSEKRGCTFTVVLTVCLIALLGGSFVRLANVRRDLAGEPAQFPDSTPEPINNPPPIIAYEPPPEAPVATDEPATDAVKKEVLARIDKMPGLTPEEKDRLYNMAQRAREMRKIVEIRFSSGQTDIAPNFAPEVKRLLETEEVQKKFRDDLTAVFVVLGFADTKGNEQSSSRVSAERAKNVVKFMVNSCGVKNVIYDVAMGSTNLVDKSNAAKNRVAEIWAVLP